MSSHCGSFFIYFFILNGKRQRRQCAVCGVDRCVTASLIRSPYVKRAMRQDNVFTQTPLGLSSCPCFHISDWLVSSILTLVLMEPVRSWVLPCVTNQWCCLQSFYEGVMWSLVVCWVKWAGLCWKSIYHVPLLAAGLHYWCKLIIFFLFFF